MARPDVLVSADWAERNLNTANTVFVDVDEDATAYHTGHIPVAVKLDWRTDLQDPVKRDFLDAAEFSELLSDRGIANDDTAIIYAARTTGSRPMRTGTSSCPATGRSSCSTVAARSGNSMTPRCPRRRLPDQPPPTPPSSRTTPSGRSATRSSMPATSRTRSTYAPRRVPRQNPGAGAPASRAEPAAGSRTGCDQRTAEPDCQRGRHLQIRCGTGRAVCRRRPGRETTAYCRIGERSSHTWFVPHELLGQQNVENYDGSWMEYGALVGAPIELGS